MHPLGKVLLVFTIIGSGCAVYFSAKLLDTKQAWMKKAEDREAELAKITEQIRNNQLLMQTREAELSRLMLGWDRYWNKIPLSVAKLDNAPPTITVNVGADQRLPEKQLLYLFATTDDAAAPAEGAAPAAGAPPAEGADKPAAPGSGHPGAAQPAAVAASFQPDGAGLAGADQTADRQPGALLDAAGHASVDADPVRGRRAGPRLGGGDAGLGQGRVLQPGCAPVDDAVAGPAAPRTATSAIAAAGRPSRDGREARGGTRACEDGTRF